MSCKLLEATLDEQNQYTQSVAALLAHYSVVGKGTQLKLESEK